MDRPARTWCLASAGERTQTARRRLHRRGHPSSPAGGLPARRRGPEPESLGLGPARAISPPALFDGDGPTQLIPTPIGPPLVGTGVGCYEPVKVDLLSDQILLRYTDGLVERRGGDGHIA